MMKLLKIPLVVLAALLLCGVPQTVLAQCNGGVCSTPVYRNVVHHDAVIVDPIAVATFFAVPVAVPQYSVGPYPTGYAPSAAPNPDAEALRQELARLRQEVAALRGQQQSPQPTAPTGAAQAQDAAGVVALFSNKCAACHDAKSAAGKGGNFTLMDGGRVVNLTAAQLLKVQAEVYSGQMPKKGEKLTDPELSAVVAWIAGQKPPG